MIEKLKKLLAKLLSRVIVFVNHVHYRWWYYITFFTNDRKKLHYWKTPLENFRFFIYYSIFKLAAVVDNWVCYDSDPIHWLKKNLVIRSLLYIPSIVTRWLLNFFRRLINILIAKQIIRRKELPLILDREYKNYFANSFACLTTELWTWSATKQAMYLCWIDKLLYKQKELGITDYMQPEAEDWHNVMGEIAEFKKALSSSSLSQRHGKN
jgi:hypothetical protein